MKPLAAFLFILITSVSAIASTEKLSQAWPATNFSKHSVDLSRVISIGQPKDGIPSIDSPVFATIQNTTNIFPPEPVITVEINGKATAYPLRILIWHQIINDTIDGIPIAVTYDPLCNSSIVFNRSVNGETLELGVSGKLYNSNMIMYDRDSQSWWQQYTGEAIAGEKFGHSLQVIPSRVESFIAFTKRYPEGRVLAPNDPTFRSYGITPYTFYDSNFPILYNGEYNGDLPKMDYVVVVGDKFWPLGSLAKQQMIITDDLVLSWFPQQSSVLDNAEIKYGRDIGNVVVQKKIDGKLVDVPYIVTFAFVVDAFK